MSERFINLNCANCGAKLDVYDDMSHFACGYCGSALLVQRRGGTVALRAVTEAIRNVQIGTDKTAAELAIVRHEKELQELRGQSTKLTHQDSMGVGCGGLALLLLGLGFCLGAGVSEKAIGFIFFIAGSLMLIQAYVRARDESHSLKAMQDQERQLETLIAEKKRIANG